jgi:hypothetical protein
MGLAVDANFHPVGEGRQMKSKGLHLLAPLHIFFGTFVTLYMVVKSTGNDF